MHQANAPEHLEAPRRVPPPGAAMILPTLLGLAAIFAIASIVLSIDESSRDTTTPPGELPFWVRYGRG
jgi:hypothetical protein